MFDQKFQEKMIKIAMEEANIAIREGNQPFGAVLVDEKGNIIERAHNICNTTMDPTAHAEIILIKKTCKKLKTKDLSAYTLFCNAESCSMCMTAIIKANIKNIYYGAKMEENANPYVRAIEIASKSKEKINLIGGILEKETTAQILLGRKK